MRRLIVLALLLIGVEAFCAYPMQPAHAAASCPSASAGLIRVTWFWQDYRIGYYQHGVSVEFAELASLPNLYLGSMYAVYNVDAPDYWQMSDGRRYYARGQSYPYILEYYVGKYDGESECQLLIGLSDECPDLAFVYNDYDYWTDVQDSVPHPDNGAFYMHYADLVALIGEPR